MTAAARRPLTGRWQLALVALAFAGPLALAAWLYYGTGEWQPRGTTNHGDLLEPIINLHEGAVPGFVEANRNHWLLLYANRGECEDDCRNALYTLRQSRLMLGKDMSRVKRLFLHGDAPPDRVFLDQHHPGLLALRDDQLGRKLTDKIPADSEAGGFFLIDPLGNLVMYFSPALRPKQMVEDIEHLLELSRIG